MLLPLPSTPPGNSAHLRFMCCTRLTPERPPGLLPPLHCPRSSPCHTHPVLFVSMSVYKFTTIPTRLPASCACASPSFRVGTCGACRRRSVSTNSVRALRLFMAPQHGHGPSLPTCHLLSGFTAKVLLFMLDSCFSGSGFWKTTLRRDGRQCLSKLCFFSPREHVAGCPCQWGKSSLLNLKRTPCDRTTGKLFVVSL